MKISYTKEEVAQIVLGFTIAHTMESVDLNSCVLSNWTSTKDFAVVEFIEPEAVTTSEF